ncbi:MAG TPA: LptF/LptG family permease [Verrucomicrobiae bacterium]|nr:LptF/LptG family permease [Verrucomicrobiae bacterium]
MPKCFAPSNLAAMRLLDRYLFRELLAPLGFCLGGIWILGIGFLLFNSIDDFQERKFHFLDIVEYALAITPQFLAMALPIVLLLALLYALTHHARHNELTAMRAAGIGLWRLCLPYLLIGLAATALLFVLNEIIVPRSINWSERIKTRHVQKPDDILVRNIFSNFGFSNARAHREWHMAQYNIYRAQMLKPQVIWTLPDKSIRQLFAAKAIYTNDVWTFFDAIEYEQANSTAELQPLLQTNVLAMPEFDETPDQIESEIEISTYQSLKRREADIPLSDILDYLKLHPHLPPGQDTWLFTKLHGRLAAPWTCFVVALIAIPFGAMPGRRNLFFGVAGSIAICFTYFVIQQLGLALGTSGRLPAWLAAWLPNMIFAALGILLTFRIK